ncbi:MAG: TetR/AcrR family transcriptional regulator, partial [Planctomycetota bacterium]
MRGKDRPDTPRAQRRRATERALVEAAHRLAARGADPLDPAALARDVGVSRPLFYRYFPAHGDFVEALLTSIHGQEDRAPERRRAVPRSAAGRILSFFEDLARPLDRHADLARALIPRSHLPGAVAAARAARRRRAIGRLADLLPARLDVRRKRAAFLMDAFLGVQLAWSKGLE